MACFVAPRSRAGYHATTMFVRFRQTKTRLQASLIETRRIDGKVRHEHIASLGSVDEPPSVDGRIAFWQRLHERLGKLSNRLDAAAQAKVMAAVHARIPMVTADEQRALQLENAKDDLRFWDALADMHASTVEGNKGLAAAAERTIAKSEAERANAAEHVEQAKERIARIERGEDVPGGLGKNPLDLERILRDAGWSRSDIQHVHDLNLLCESVADGEDAVIKKLVAVSMRSSDLASKRWVRKMLRVLRDTESE